MPDRDRLLDILGWTAFALGCSVFFLPVINPDIFWHLSAGKYTLAHLAPPRTDFLSWPLAGTEWVDFEWLTQAFYYLVYKAGGFEALLLFKALLLALTLLVFRSIALLYGRRSVLPLSLLFFAAAIMGNTDLRPENFTLLFFTVTLYQLEKRRLSGPSAGRVPLPAFMLFFALWTNLHAGYLYGLALIGLYAAGEFFEEELPFVYGRAPFVRPSGSLFYLKLFFIGLVSSLANPYGWKIYSVIANHQKYLSTLQEYIQEWSTFDLTSAYQWPYAAALVGVLGSFMFFLLRKRHMVYSHLAGLFYFGWAAANHGRHIPFFIITGSAFALALPWEGLPASRFVRRAAAGAAALFLLVSLWFYNAFIWNQYTGSGTDFRWGSEGLSIFLKANTKDLSKLRVYNEWGWGGWLGWELGPEYKPFIDGRYLFHDRITEIMGLSTNIENWRNLIRKYKFDLMLITLDGPRVPIRQKLSGGAATMSWRPSYLFYLPKKEWAVVYWDYRVAALVRRSAVPPAWLAEHEFSYLRPVDTINLVAPVMTGDIPLSAIRTETFRYLKNHAAGKENSANAEVIDFMRGLEEMCKKKDIKCKP